MGQRAERVRPSIQATNKHQSPGTGGLDGRMHQGVKNGGAGNNQHGRSGGAASMVAIRNGAINLGGSGAGMESGGTLVVPTGHGGIWIDAGSTLVQWVAEEAFRMKEMMNNTLEGEGSTPRP
ncbi:hypothetical protein LIER_42991 [Lithospermum erythrorhizon]|uniref:Uncharacterized protein n=1 Tax=Lithospermum erythrorhizon TaxID=34254 RepID=A0AAV3P9E5_LITER